MADVTIDGAKRDWNLYLESSGTTLSVPYSGLLTQHTISRGSPTAYPSGTSFYIMSTGLIRGSDADAITSMPVYCISCESGIDGDTITVLIHGYFKDTSQSWTVGGLIYASVSEGLLSQTAPVGIGDQVQVVGIAVASDTMYFKPDYTIVQI